jgi:ABC-type Fe3+/spermidine/putrescine transport system ATPase subunit
MTAAPASTGHVEDRASSLVLDGVTKHYGRTVAARSLGLTCRPGELVTLIGPSG